MRLSYLSFAVLLLLASIPKGVNAQNKQTLTGEILAPDGSVVPGANVTLIGEGQAQPLSLKTDDEGAFEFSRVSPGNYIVFNVFKHVNFQDYDGVDFLADIWPTLHRLPRPSAPGFKCVTASDFTTKVNGSTKVSDERQSVLLTGGAGFIGSHLEETNYRFMSSLQGRRHANRLLCSTRNLP